MYCRNCGKEVCDGDNFCPQCGTRATKILAQSPIVKNPGLPAVMSTFIPGIGQIYNGQIIKGVIFVIMMIATMILLSSHIVTLQKNIVLIVYLILWIYNIFDVYKTAEKINLKIE